MKTIVISVRVTLPALASTIEAIERISGTSVGKSEACRLAIELFASKHQYFTEESAVTFLSNRGVFATYNDKNKKTVFESLIQYQQEKETCNIPQHIADDVNEALKNLKTS